MAEATAVHLQTGGDDGRTYMSLPRIIRAPTELGPTMHACWVKFDDHFLHIGTPMTMHTACKQPFHFGQVHRPEGPMLIRRGGICITCNQWLVKDRDEQEEAERIKEHKNARPALKFAREIFGEDYEEEVIPAEVVYAAYRVSRWVIAAGAVLALGILGSIAWAVVHFWH